MIMARGKPSWPVSVRSRKRIDDPVRRLNWPNIAALAVWLASVGTLLIGAVRSRKPRAASLNSPDVR